STWARKRYQALDVSGIYVLMCKEPRAIEFAVGERTRKKAFTADDRDKAFKLVAQHFGQKDFDRGLLAPVNGGDRTLDRNIGRSAGTASSKTGSSSLSDTSAKTDKTKKGTSFMDGIWGWICIGIVVLLGLWLVFGLIRAFTGGGRPAGGG